MIKFVLMFCTGEYDDTMYHTVPFVYSSKEELENDIRVLAAKYIDEYDECNKQIQALNKEASANCSYDDEYHARSYAIRRAPYILKSDGYELDCSQFYYETYVGNKMQILMPEIKTLDEWFETREKV